MPFPDTISTNAPLEENSQCLPAPHLQSRTLLTSPDNAFHAYALDGQLAQPNTRQSSGENLKQSRYRLATSLARVCILTLRVPGRASQTYPHHGRQPPKLRCCCVLLRRQNRCIQKASTHIPQRWHSKSWQSDRQNQSRHVLHLGHKWHTALDSHDPHGSPCAHWWPPPKLQPNPDMNRDHSAPQWILQAGKHHLVKMSHQIKRGLPQSIVTIRPRSHPIFSQYAASSRHLASKSQFDAPYARPSL